MARIVDVHYVMEVTGLSRTTIWRREKAGDFPERRELAPGRIGWLETEILDWLGDRPRGIRSRSRDQG